MDVGLLWVIEFIINDGSGWRGRRLLFSLIGVMYWDGMIDGCRWAKGKIFSWNTTFCTQIQMDSPKRHTRREFVSVWLSVKQNKGTQKTSNENKETFFNNTWKGDKLSRNMEEGVLFMRSVFQKIIRKCDWNNNLLATLRRCWCHSAVVFQHRNVLPLYHKQRTNH